MLTAAVYTVEGFFMQQANKAMTQSNTFSNAAWTKNTAGTGVAPTLTDSYTTAPDGSPATQTVGRREPSEDPRRQGCGAAAG